MEQVKLSALDQALLRRDKVTVKIEVKSQVTRGIVLREITVWKVVDHFEIDTTLYEFRRDPDKETFVCTMAERDAKLVELGCPATSAHWDRTRKRS